MPNGHNSGTKRAVIVLAMHRSGSSALTRALNFLGLDVGDPATLLGCNPDNPTGFWEHQSLQFLNDRMLEHHARDWDTWAPLSDKAIADLSKTFGAEMREQIQKTFGNQGNIVWKDPRNMLLLDVWRPVFEEMGYSIRVILGIRHPAAVAGSLQNRNGFPALKSVAIWTAHYAGGIKALRDIPCSVVDYDRLLGNWREELGRCFRELDLDWPVDTSGSAIDSFLSPDLQHNQGSTLGPELEPFGFPAEQFYNELRNGYPEKELSSKVQEALAVYVRSGTELVQHDVEKYVRANKQLSEHLYSLETAYHRLDVHEKHLQSEYDDLRQWCDNLTVRQKTITTSWSWRLTYPLRLSLRGIDISYRAAATLLRKFI